MKFLFDFLPVVFFFIAYKFFGDLPPALIDLGNQIPGVDLQQGNPKHAIIFATLVIIIATIMQNILHWLAYKKLEKMHLISLVILIVFGSITVVSRDPDFIKWKVSIFNWFFASVMLGSLFIGKKTLIERMMSHAVSVPKNIWRILTYSWGAFFIFIGVLNYIVAFHYAGIDDENWVNFKLFGILGLTFAFLIAQGIYLAKHATPPL
jgi:intracellular septation protein